MTEPSNLRDAKKVPWDILRADTAQDAAAIIEADRAAVEAATIAKVVAWLRSDKIVLSMDGSAEDVAASAIEAGEWDQ